MSANSNKPNSMYDVGQLVISYDDNKNKILGYIENTYIIGNKTFYKVDWFCDDPANSMETNASIKKKVELYNSFKEEE